MVINGRPLFVGRDNNFGLWFDGKFEPYSWTLGYLSDLDKGNYNYGFLQSIQDSFCPTASNTWREWQRNDWIDANAARVQCVTGKVMLLNYNNDEDRQWRINSDCSAVRITSTYFDIEEYYDFITIDGIQSTQRHSPINQLVRKSSFPIRFNSDSSGTGSGFALDWVCEGNLFTIIIQLIVLYSVPKPSTATTTTTVIPTTSTTTSTSGGYIPLHKKRSLILLCFSPTLRL